MSPESNDPVLAGEEIRLLAEIGYMACGGGRIRSAREIFEGLRHLRPDCAFPYIGLAMACLSAGAPQEAISVLRDQGLDANPEDTEIKVFLGMALAMASRAHESRRVLGEVVAAADETMPERRLAEKLLAHTPADAGARPPLEPLATQAPARARIQPV